MGRGHIVIAGVQVDGAIRLGLAARQVSLVNLPRAEEPRPSRIHDGIAKILLGLGDIRSAILPMGKGLRYNSRQGKHGRGVGARAWAVVVEEDAVSSGSTWSATTPDRAHPPLCRRLVQRKEESQPCAREEAGTHTFQGWVNGGGKDGAMQCPSGARNTWLLRERLLTSRHGC